MTRLGSPIVGGGARALTPLRREVEAYFRGTGRTFATPVDLELVPDGFGRRVLEATMAIPYGELVTYGDVAASAGSLRAGRAAGRRPEPMPDRAVRPVPSGRPRRRNDRRATGATRTANDGSFATKAPSDRTFRRSREKMVPMSFRRTLIAVLGLGAARERLRRLRRAVGRRRRRASSPFSLSLEVASSDLAVGAPQHFELGIFSSDGQSVQLLSFGQMAFSFSFLGDGSQSPQPGPQATGTYVGAFGTQQSGPAPAFTDPNEARGIYQAEVAFDQAGTWQVDATVDVPGTGTQTLSAPFVVSAEASLAGAGRPGAADGEPDGRLEGRARGRDRFAGARRRAGARSRAASVDDRRRARAAPADRGDLLDARRSA